VDVSDDDLLNEDSTVVPDTIPETDTFSSQLVVRLRIKSQPKVMAEAIINTNTTN